jgi:DNA helicase-2/ATP-dependent DNA helicase PcrA
MSEEMKLEALNEPQRRAVAHADGPLVVFAGAGSGKTRVITYRIANLVATHSVPPYRILAVTFTNKAAGEMRERLGHLLGDELTRELWVGTFHAVCVRLIRRYSEAIGISKRFTIYDDSDQKAVMKRVIKELELDERRVTPQTLLSAIEREKQEARGPGEALVRDFLSDTVARAYQAYEDKLRQANAVDFNDLLLHVLRFVEREDNESADHLRKRFSHILVDEFQDTNLVQYRLVRALGREKKNVCVVGDDDQSIYRWRGADIRNIRNFTSDFPDAKLVKLEQNYRSTKNVVAAALGVIRYAKGRQPKELWTGNADGAKVKVVHTANERDEAAWVVRGVTAAIAAGVSPREIAVFYRVHAQSRVLEEAMRKSNVPYQIVGGTRIINKPPRKLGQKAIGELVDIARRERVAVYDAIEPLCKSGLLATAAQRSLEAFHALCERARAALDGEGLHDVAETLMHESGYFAWLEAQDSVEADSRADNLREFLGSIEEYEHEVVAADEAPSLDDYLTRISLVSDADTMKDAPRVPMMTIHAAKGLEFERVFLTGLEDGLFPLKSQQDPERDDLEEERRLAYVAITRARKELAITFAATRLIYGQTRSNTPSRFLADIPPANQERSATDAMMGLSRQFTRGAPVSYRDVALAGRAPISTRPRERYEPPPRPAGERYVERDAGERRLERDPGERYVDFDDDAPRGFGARRVRVGMRVRHAKFGVGEVRDVRGGGPDPTVTVTFPEGLKTVKLRYLSPL